MQYAKKHVVIARDAAIADALYLSAAAAIVLPSSEPVNFCTCICCSHLASCCLAPQLAAVGVASTLLPVPALHSADAAAATTLVPAALHSVIQVQLLQPHCCLLLAFSTCSCSCSPSVYYLVHHQQQQVQVL
jgi:hypothetical protein